MGRCDFFIFWCHCGREHNLNHGVVEMVIHCDKETDKDADSEIEIKLKQRDEKIF